MKEKYIQDLHEIKHIMNRASRFISISGLSGIFTGFIALVGALTAHLVIFKKQGYLVYHAVAISSENLIYLFAIAASTLLISLITAIYFTRKKTKVLNQPVWDLQTKRLLINLLIPLVSGGILCLMLLLKGFIGFLPPLTLIFYGLALVNGSKYTYSELRSLGFIQILLGLISFQLIGYGLFFWALGFGVVQIGYGLLIQRRQPR